MSAPSPGGDATAAPPAPSKPRLKINVSRSASFVGDGATTPGGAPPSATAPLAAPSEGARKVKLKISSSQPPTPAVPSANKDAAMKDVAEDKEKEKQKDKDKDKEKDKNKGLPPVVTTKAGRQAKPSQKLIESKKRSLSDDEDEAPLRGSTAGTAGHGPPPATKIKIKPIVKVGGAGGGTKAKTGSKAGLTQLVLKPRGRPPVHPPGDGYDSEASDNEVDPAIEEQFILRMLPGEHADYVRWCMENGKIGLPKSAGGADIYMRFFEEESRRGVVCVKGQCFAAVLVDLPTITESMKTWDRKSLMKSADICQMLLVFQAVRSEEEARHVPLPSIIDSNFKWPHGLTPPMHDCVNRRFAKTISRKEIEDKEAEVERLLAEDAKCASTKWEWVDERNGAEEEGEEDAEGEMDDSLGYFGQQHESQGVEEANDFDLEADLEAAFADELFAETPATAMDTQTPTAALATPSASAALQESIEQSESEEDDDDDDDDDDDEDLDEDARARRDEEHSVKEMINDLTRQLASRVADLERTQNKILRTRLENQIKSLKAEIALKQSSIGIEADD